jgi:hypothetical protein
MRDQKPQVFGVQRITNSCSEAKKWNEQGYGIFWTPNRIDGHKKNDNVTSIEFWFLDFDAKNGTKEEHIARIEKSPIVPTYVVETKNGYHVYFKAIDGTKENWTEIMNRLIFHFQSDKIKAMSHMIRVPGFFHLKDPANPFLVKKIFSSDSSYTERQMGAIFKETRFLRNNNPNFWKSVNDLPCEEGLLRLSGTDAVNGDTFYCDFVGNVKRIFVNDEQTSSWIDRDGKIASLNGGGPGLFNWINWYHDDKKKTTEFIKKHFPEVNRG